MVTLEKKLVNNEYQAILDETESITITINGNQVFTATIAAGNKARISFRIDEGLATDLSFPQP